MPIAIKLFTDEEEVDGKEKSRAIRCRWLVNLAFFVLAISWFVTSAVTGDFSWRMRINVLFFFVTVIFVVSLLRIRRLISTVNFSERLSPNHCLMNLNLVTFASECLIFSILYIVSM